MITKSEEVGLFVSQILSSESKVMDVKKRPKPLVILKVIIWFFIWLVDLVVIYILQRECKYRVPSL
jgi:hypothetical protein